ncbi:sensor of ECF-type sigma factor [Winogradskyella litorisediminis]|uniref:Sensor of ECF-type sigma factor n=1 Tax=Winogradskyella litorisediminis TaxID=1156618 RepID=A0ABW3NCV3_9FLAO
MKKIITITLLFIGLISFAQPQRNGQMRDKIKAQKVAFITEKLELTTDEAEKFWPIYNAFEESTYRIKREFFIPIRKQMRKNADISDAQANSFLDEVIKGENQIHRAKQKLLIDLKTAIPARKIIKLKGVEDEFNRELLQKLRDYRAKRKKN